MKLEAEDGTTTDLHMETLLGKLHENDDHLIIKQKPKQRGLLRTR